VIRPISDDDARKLSTKSCLHFHILFTVGDGNWRQLAHSD